MPALIALALAGLQPVPIATAPSPTVETPTVRCREQWQADAIGPGLRAHHIDRITVHHSATGAPKWEPQVARLLYGFQKQHQSAPKNYPDVAYHLLIDAAGRVWEGRPLWASGDTPTDYDPTGHLLVCLVGNFELGPPPPPQWRALVEVVAWASQRWQVPVERIAGHGDHAHTLCPGKHLRSRIAAGELAAAVQERARRGKVVLPWPCPERRPADQGSHAHP